MGQGESRAEEAPMHLRRDSESLATPLALTEPVRDSPAAPEQADGSLIGSSSLNTRDPDRNVKAWCSWCYKESFHGRIQRNYILRNVYKCQECSRRTLQCRFCKVGMARGHTDWDDELCAVCDGTIPEWGGDAASAAVTVRGPCSWCFAQDASHTLRATNIVRRNTYNCDICGGPTAICLSCQHAFARCSSLYDELLCAKCDSSIESWEQFESNKLQLEARGAPVREHVDPYKSYAPWRRGNYVRFLVDGQEFFEAAYEIMLRARESIFMSWWQFEDFVYLKREPELDEESRVDRVLVRKAEEGVMIYVILWRENHTSFVNNFTYEMKRRLKSLHPNIVCIRHQHPTPLTVYVCHHQKFMCVDQDIAIIGGFDICLGRYDTRAHVLTDVKEPHTWQGVDYYNPHYGRPKSIENWDVDIYDRNQIPRMPWHDVSVLVKGMSARDASRNFIQRWNHHKEVAYPHRDIETLVPKNGPLLEFEESKEEFMAKVQCIRSLDMWSGGLRNERSIYGAYLNAVNEAQHYIYIENQYFSSNLAGAGVENQVAQRILDKLIYKIRRQEVFRCIFVIPQPEETGDSAMEILRWQYLTINRGGTSLLEQLMNEFPSLDVEKYVSFFFLRQGGFLHNRPVTEKVFCHSKIMIVDDSVALVTSANFNDRSFLGDRDSELGVIVQDENEILIPMDGVEVRVGKKVHEFRMSLWAEHLGLRLPEELDNIIDPVSDNTYERIWLATARSNTSIFEMVFPSIPRNIYRTMKAFEEAGGLNIPAQAVTDGQELLNLRGTLTLHPIAFLMDEDINTMLSLIVGEYLMQ